MDILKRRRRRRFIASILAIITINKEENAMLDYIQKNPVTCVVILIILVALIAYLLRYNKNLLKKAALYAVAQAEEAWSSGTGKVKFAEVYLYLRRNYPIITFFVTEEKLRKIIEAALVSLKEMIDNSDKCETKEEKIEEKIEEKTEEAVG